MSDDKVAGRHLERKAIIYIRQSSAYQVAHNEESRQLQYAMKQRVVALGWHEVDVIDDDLGRSAATASKRQGFQRMVAEVCLGKVGAVAAREVSRFARNNHDWHQLVEVCSLVETLLIDHEAVYDPRRANDRLLLGLKGSLSEYELDLLRQRSVEARWAKAERGELITHTPVGFVKGGDQGIDKDPDQRVQCAITTVFDKFVELGSARQTLIWLLDNDLQIPAQRYGETGLQTHWRRPYYHAIVRILRDPTYAGGYAYGRTAKISRVREGVLDKRQVVRPPEQWRVLIRDHHDGYICWDAFERNQRMLDNNVNSFRSQRDGAVKQGSALLTGLLRCRRCGRKLRVTYTGKHRRVPRYSCEHGTLDSGEAKCLSVGGTSVDDAVSRQIVRVVQPCAIEAAMLALNEASSEKEGLVQARLLELKAARYAADRAWEQYDAVDPKNRLVADELERRWNVALRRVGEAEHRVEQAKQAQCKQQPAATAQSVGDLAGDLQRVWHDTEGDVRIKKRIIRTLIEEIVLDVDHQDSEVELVIHWKGGLHSVLRAPRRRRGQRSGTTPPDIVDAVRILALVCTDDKIATYLNRNRLATGRGDRWTRRRIVALRNRRAIAVFTPRCHDTDGWMNLTQAAEYVSSTAKTVRRMVERGVLNGLHPLPDGPWILNRQDLDIAKDRGLFDDASGSAAGPSSAQQTLDIPTT